MSMPSFTKTYHSSSYPAISPTRPELSCKGKTVIITGGGQGIGAATALSFAKAGATKIALLGRTESKLLDTKSQLESAHSGITVFTGVVDTSNAEAVGRIAHEVRASLGAWDIFAHCAGVTGELARLTGVDIDDWWSVFEINTKFIAIFAKHFLTKCRMPGATFLCTNAGAAFASANNLPPCSAYSSSKMASARLCEWLAVEKPDLRVFSIHPGVIKTAMGSEFMKSDQLNMPVDDVELAADFYVWCTSPEAEFLRGRFVWANWDVEEMIQKKGELESNPALLTCQLGGWPF